MKERRQSQKEFQKRGRKVWKERIKEKEKRLNNSPISLILSSSLTFAICFSRRYFSKHGKHWSMFSDDFFLFKNGGSFLLSFSIQKAKNKNQVLPLSFS